jgi:hypothetical protein
MNPESEAWKQLRDSAAGRLRPGFADRVLLAAREVTGPSLFSQVAFSAATAAFCLWLLVFVQGRRGQSNLNQSLADWQQVAVASDATPVQ